MKPKCYLCEEPGVIIQGTTWRCDKHYRFMQMRASAKRNKKTVPSMAELHLLLPQDMRCPICKTKMIWRWAYGAKKDVITLQHDESGRHRLICLRCNTIHGAGPKDLVYTLKEDEKYCRKCGKTKHKSQFGKDKRSLTGCTPSCRECINKYDRKKYKKRKFKAVPDKAIIKP